MIIENAARLNGMWQVEVAPMQPTADAHSDSLDQKGVRPYLESFGHGMKHIGKFSQHHLGTGTSASLQLM